VGAGGVRWTKDGHDRVYFNDLRELFGLRVSRFNTGNVSSASWKGAKISNNEATAILSALQFGQLWFDVSHNRYVWRIADCRRHKGDKLAKAIVSEIERRAAGIAPHSSTQTKQEQTCEPDSSSARADPPLSAVARRGRRPSPR
jgi:hypothetical protein